MPEKIVQQNEQVSQLAAENVGNAVYNSQNYKDPMTLGNTLVENLLHERSYSLDHFKVSRERIAHTKKTEKQASEAMMKRAYSFETEKAQG